MIPTAWSTILQREEPLRDGLLFAIFYRDTLTELLPIYSVIVAITVLCVVNEIVK